MTELESYLRNALAYQVNLAEESEILAGDGTGTHFSGLITEAQRFDTSLLDPVDGWTRIDILGRAVQQILADDELPPTFAVIHPSDFWEIRLTKNSFGEYILGPPMQANTEPNLF